ncbi:hypothetical protein K438DRAFT_1964634 [Mycena galopus ATCC 62051]|nr:hypothetical protein K438DRAFT_1964634 [Mycena galopus ATCC 62051]
MSTPVIHCHPGRITGQHLALGTVEDVQYFSRLNLGHPLPPTLALNPNGPIATVEDVINRTMTRYYNGDPIPNDPTFSSSPHAEYLGASVMPDGQVLHRSKATNVYRVFLSHETGQPVTMTCHEFTFHLSAPEEPNVLWNLETVYPSEERLQRTMAGFTPQGYPGAVTLSFPSHTTDVPPPMLTGEERARFFRGHANRAASAQDVLRNEDHTIEPERLVAAHARWMREELVTLREPVPRLPQQLYRRASKALSLGGDLFDTHVTDEEDDATSVAESMPDLISNASEGGGSNASLDLGLCDLCLEPTHVLEVDCLAYLATRQREAEDGHVLGIPASQEVFDVPTQPDFRDESVTGATDNLRDLDLAPPDDDFQALVDVAVDARQAFEEFAMEYEGELVAIGSEGAKRKVADLGPNTATKSGAHRPDTPFPFSRTTTPFYESHLPRITGSPEGTPTRGEHGGATLRHTNSSPVVLTSHADRVNIPVFGTRGEIVTRDNWSSSPASIVGYKGVGLPNVPVENLETSSSGKWSLVESDGAWGWPPSTPSHYGDTASSGSESSASPSDSGFSFTSCYEFYDDCNRDLLDSLTMWVERGAAHQRDHRRFENEMAVEPLHQAIQMLYGPLSNFVDYLTMAGHGVKDIVATAFPTYEHAVASIVPGETAHNHSSAVFNEPSSLISTSASPDRTLTATVERMGAQIATTWNGDLIEEPDRDGWRHVTISPTPVAPENFADVDHAAYANTTGGIPSLANTQTPPSQSLPAAAEYTGIPLGMTRNGNLVEAADGDGWRHIIVMPTESALPAGATLPSPNPNKRKHPEDEEGGLNQRGRCKKTRKFDGDALRRTVIEREARKAGGALDAQVIALTAGVRLAILEALRRIEDLVWHQYGVTKVRISFVNSILAEFFRHTLRNTTQYAFPDKLIRHPLLFPMEAAKMQVLWHVL